MGEGLATRLVIGSLWSYISVHISKGTTRKLMDWINTRAVTDTKTLKHCGSLRVLVELSSSLSSSSVAHFLPCSRALRRVLAQRKT
jgi:hypothetical protein